MKKIAALFIISMILSATIFAQKKDTAYVPVYPKTDTAKADGRKTIIYLAPDGLVRHEQGFPTLQGWVRPDSTGKLQWVAAPIQTGAIDTKGHMIPRVISFGDPFPPIGPSKPADAKKPEQKKPLVKKS